MISAREVAAAALLSLPRATPSRLRTIISVCGGSTSAVSAIRDGSIFELSPLTPIDVIGGWQRNIDIAYEAARLVLERRGTRVLIYDDVDWPIMSSADSMPTMLFAEGDGFEVLTRPRIAVVGTRQPTPHGAADAREIGCHLADAGAVVVSGLAYGIDARAHDGAIRANGLTIGVAGTGLDIPYPAGNTDLWAGVRAHGIIVGENAFGTLPSKQIFPVRNRIIAGLVSAVVIVEAAARGGAMHTAKAALALGLPIYAVPGSRRNPMAEGCNQLIADGAIPLIDPVDIALAISNASVSCRPVTLKQTALCALTSDARTVFLALGGEPASLEQVVSRTNLALAEAAGATRELERAGRLTRSRGRLWPM